MVLCAMVSITTHFGRRRGQADTCPVTCRPCPGTAIEVHRPPRPLTGPR